MSSSPKMNSITTGEKKGDFPFFLFLLKTLIVWIPTIRCFNMIIAEKNENIFDSDCDLIVIPVNCIGIMGAGLAKQLKERYLDVYYLYKHMCKTRDIRIDLPVVVRDKKTQRPFILLPTKEEPKDKSTLYIIQKNLQWLRENAISYKDKKSPLYGYKSIAIPPIGCGCGELKWDDVKELIYQNLNDVKMDIVVYNPFFVAHDNKNRTFFGRKK